MALSNSTDFLVNRDEIITEALLLLGVIYEGQTPDTDSVASLARTLNMMLKNWQADGLRLTSWKPTYLFSSSSSDSYQLNVVNSTSQHISSILTYTLPSSGTAGAGTLQVVSGTVENSSWLLLKATDGTYFKQPVTSVSGTTATLTGTLLYDVDAGSTYIAINPSLVAPSTLKITSAYRRQIDSSIDTPLRVVGKEEYNELSSKDSEGSPLTISLQPSATGQSVYIWPKLATDSQYIILHTEEEIMDLDSSTDNFSVGKEWFLPIAYGLAKYSAPKYGIPAQDFSRISMLSDELYSRAIMNDEETYTSLYFEYDTRNR